MNLKSSRDMLLFQPSGQKDTTKKLIKSFLGKDNKENAMKQSLKDLESKINLQVRRRSQMSKLDVRDLEQSFSRSTFQDKAHLTQTGNFGRLDSQQQSERFSTQKTMPAFQFSDIPDIQELLGLQNFIIDLETMPPNLFDELKKLSSIIMFRVRNLQYDLERKL
ncbi:hypothetical protein pb186bvf_018749 [Paramecium bursaria]